MSLAQQLLFNVPSLMLGFIVIGGSIILSVLGLLIVRRFVHHSKLKPHHDVADPILGVLGAIYAVLIAFVVVSVWENYNKSNANVELEANYLADIYRDAEGLSVELRQKVNPFLREYRDAVIKYEWPAMRKGMMSKEVEGLMNKIWSCYTSYQAKNPTEQAFLEESIDKLNSFRELRRQRLMDARTGINPMLWYVLVAGAAAIICFTFLFGTESAQGHITMVVLLSATIALILFTILSLDFPFTGGISISPEPFRQILLN